MEHIDLSSFGLDKKAGKIYLTLLELGESNLSTILKKTGIKRTTAYDVLNDLRNRGLVAFTKLGKRTHYVAEDPHAIGTHIEDSKKKFNQILPELLSISNAILKKPKIRYYEGVEGMRQVYEDTLKYPDQELLGWVSEKALSVLGKKFLYSYLASRMQKKIWVRAIATETSEMAKYAEEDVSSLRKTRLVAKDDFPFEVEVNLYGKRNIAIMSFEEEFGMIIESEKMWKTLKSIFEMGWIFAEKT